MGYFKNIIVSDFGSKHLVKLKDMALASTMFNDVELARSCKEVLQHIKSKKKRHFDLIITSYRFDGDELLKLIIQIKKIKKHFRGALLMVLPNAIKVEEVGDHFFAGVDGFLLEPFGVTDLEVMFKLAQNVSLFANEQREEALEIILSQTIVQSNHKSQSNESGEDDKLDSIEHATLNLGEENAETFKKIALEKTVAEAKPTKVVGGDESQLNVFKEQAQIVADDENDFSKVEDKEIENYLSKLNDPKEDIALIREGIYRVRNLLMEQGITVDSKEIVNEAKEQGCKFDEEEALARLKKKMATFGSEV